jgi:hypothetical protein
MHLAGRLRETAARHEIKVDGQAAENYCTNGWHCL